MCDDNFLFISDFDHLPEFIGLIMYKVDVVFLYQSSNQQPSNRNREKEITGSSETSKE